jgi:hypothetical protein
MPVVDLSRAAVYARRRPFRTPHEERFMTTFDDREKAFENKFAHDEELKFRALARRNKHLGLWAAAKLGKTGEEADAYAKALILAELEDGGDEDVFRKLKADLGATGNVTDEDIRTAMIDFLEQAVVQVQLGN